MIQKCTAVIGVLAAFIIITGCSSSQGKKAVQVSKIVISPAKGQVKVGKALELFARGYDKKGNIVYVNPVWKIESGAKFATLDRNTGERVVLTGKAQGTCVISADLKGVSGTSSVEVKKK